MSQLVQPSTFLRRVLIADALLSTVAGTVMAFGAQALQALLGLSPSLLFFAGLALFPYAICLIWLATRSAVPRAAVWVPIVLNVVWAVDCVLVALGALGGMASPTLLGKAFLAAHIAVVLVFAELEFVGLRRAYATLRA